MAKSLTPVRGEVLPPRLTKKDTDAIERRAITLFRSMEKTSILFAMELYRLQEGQAHLARGYSNFGEYIQNTFTGVSSTNAFAIARQGRVLVILESNGRINPGMSVDELPGTTGVRVLAKIYKELGEETMIAVYDRALQSGRKVIEETVLAAMQELIAPPVHELGTGAEEEPEPEEEESEDYPELSEETENLLDTLGDCLSDIRLYLLDGRQGDIEKFVLEVEEKVPELRKLVVK